MSRFLFVVPPLAGHVNPTVAVAQELQSRGHRVAWVGHPRILRPLLPDGARLFELDDDTLGELVKELGEKPNRVRGLAALKFLWQDFLIPLAHAMEPGVEEACREFQPTVLVVDQQAFAGSIAARRLGLKWATSGTTSADVMASISDMPKVQEWVEEQFAGLQRAFGLPPLPRPDLSDDLVIVFSTRALAGNAKVGEQFRFVGPAMGARAADTEFPWDELPDERPRVLITLGTINVERGRPFFSAAIEALADESCTVVMVAPPELVSEVPANFFIRPHIPQLELLPHLDAVVCHGGHNTVCEALYFGLPLVVAPIKDDQMVVAKQVADSGAGLRIRFARMSSTRLRDAVFRVLTEKSFRVQAARIRTSFRSALGAQAAATHLEAFAARTR